MGKNLLSIILLIGGIIVLAIGVANDSDGLSCGFLMIVVAIIIYFIKGNKN